MTETSHITRRALFKSVPAACVATVAVHAAANAALRGIVEPSLNDLIARHEQAVKACEDTFKAMHALEERIKSEWDTDWSMVPHCLMDSGENMAGSYSQMHLYGTDFEKHSDRVHAELRERLCPGQMQSAMPEHYAEVSSALDRSRARVGQIFAERTAELERRKDETGHTAASASYKAAEDAEVRAKIAILTYKPMDAVEAQRKAEYLNVDDLFDDEEFARALIRSFMDVSLQEPKAA